MLNRQRQLTLPRPTAASTATQLRVCLTLQFLWRQGGLGGVDMTALMTMIHSAQTADGHEGDDTPGDMHEGERELGHGHEDMRMGDEDFDELRLCDELARENRQLVAEALGEGDRAAPAAV